MNGTLYDLVNGSVERRVFAPLRSELFSGLRGEVVDVGAGTGANFPYYPADAHVFVLEPDRTMVRRAEKKLQTARARIDVKFADDRFLDTLDAASIDVVVFTLVLCTIEEPSAALRRAKRVLKPDGVLVVIEHVRSAGLLGRLQDVIAPLWRHVTGGCHLNRDTEAEVAAAGFETRALRTRALCGLNPIQKIIYGRVTAAR